MRDEAVGRARRLAASVGDLPWVAVSLLALAACLYYPYASQVPDLGFTLIPATWEVIQAEPCAPGRDCPRVGDHVLALDELTFERYQRDRTAELLAPFAGDGRAVVRLVRGGTARDVEVRLRAKAGLALSSLSIAVLPLSFWLAGMALVIFLRPRDERWLVLVLFSYVTALVIASGLASAWHAGGAAVVLHVVIWLFLPIAVHLHLLLPSPLLGRWRWRLLVPLYAVSLLFAALDTGGRLAPDDYHYVASFLAGVALSLGLLALRLVLPAAPAVKIANRIMAFGVTVGFAPVVFFFFVLPLLMARRGLLAAGGESLVPWVLALSLVAVPVLPSSYLYAIYRHSLAALEFRASRLLGVCGFFALWAPLYAVILVQLGRFTGGVDGGFLSASLVVSLVLIVTAPALRRRFQAAVDRHVFGIRHTPEEVAGMVSERLSSAFDRTTLAAVVLEHILPTLLIRRSGLYLFADGAAEPLYEQDLPPGDASPDAAALRALLPRSGVYLAPAPDQLPARFDWVRLVLPLALQGETIGVWLFGRRDPDDYFPVSDIHLLSTVANQIAPAAENIRLFQRAQQEIAQRKAAEVEIRRSEGRFRTLFEATVEGIAIVGEGAILEVNHALPALLGYEAGELLGRRLEEVLVDLPLAPGEGVRETMGARRDGSLVDVEVEAASLLFQGQDATVVAVRDVTRRKRDEAEKKRLEQQLLHAQKMEAIGRLSSGLAHDFNNCLGVILGYGDLLLGDLADDPVVGPRLEAIQEAGLRAAALTKELLAFARRQPVEPDVVDFNQIVSSLERMLGRLIGDDITLVVELDPRLGLVLLDPGRMEHVLVNLAANARHAMPRGGLLTVRTAALEVDRLHPAPHADVPPGRWALVTVADTGIGMDAETLARVFEPFFTTRKAGEGTGLGLSNAYGFVTQSGGHIFVDSAPYEGACFSIYLPVVEGGTTVKAAGSGAVRGGSETVLVVEDEKVVRGVVVALLRTLGYEVIEAGSGPEALAAVERYAGTVHLLLTDVSMPVMDGRELARRVAALRPATQVLFMSGQQVELPAGSSFLAKPFSAQSLGSAVRAVLDTPATRAA